jgi:hypothetical protein
MPVIYGTENVISFPTPKAMYPEWNFDRQMSAGVLRKPGYEGYVVLYKGVYHTSVYDKHVRFHQGEFKALDEAVQDVEKTIQFQTVNDVTRPETKSETKSEPEIHSAMKWLEESKRRTGHLEPLIVRPETLFSKLKCDNPDCDGTCNGLHVPLPIALPVTAVSEALDMNTQRLQTYCLQHDDVKTITVTKKSFSQLKKEGALCSGNIFYGSHGPVTIIKQEAEE